LLQRGLVDGRLFSPASSRPCAPAPRYCNHRTPCRAQRPVVTLDFCAPEPGSFTPCYCRPHGRCYTRRNGCAAAAAASTAATGGSLYTFHCMALLPCAVNGATLCTARMVTSATISRATLRGRHSASCERRRRVVEGGSACAAKEERRDCTTNSVGMVAGTAFL